MLADVSVGSKTDLTAHKSLFRFAPEADIDGQSAHVRNLPILLQKSVEAIAEP